MVMVLMRNFNYSNVSWKCKKSRRFLEYVDDNFLLHMIEKPMTRAAMLDLVLIDKEEMVANVKIKSSLGWSN